VVVTVQRNEIYGDRTNTESKKARTPELGTNYHYKHVVILLLKQL